MSLHLTRGHFLRPPDTPCSLAVTSHVPRNLSSRPKQPLIYFLPLSLHFYTFFVPAVLIACLSTLPALGSDLGPRGQGVPPAAGQSPGTEQTEAPEATGASSGQLLCPSVSVIS